MIDPTDAVRLAIISDLITRYLADEIDRRILTEQETILRLSGDWPMDDAGRLLMLTAHHLFMFNCGDWPEDTL